jgi:hypothetical protein
VTGHNPLKGNTMKWLLARLSEPSTWAGVGVFASQLLPAIATHNPIAIVGVIAGALAAVTPEQAPA